MSSSVFRDALWVLVVVAIIYMAALLLGVFSVNEQFRPLHNERQRATENLKQPQPSPQPR
jgi:hypothetical protein